MSKRLTEVAEQAFAFVLSAPSAKEIDAMLQKLNAASHSLECDALAIWLRATFSQASELPSWKPLCDQTALLCTLRGIDPELMLCGLI